MIAQTLRMRPVHMQPMSSSWQRNFRPSSASLHQSHAAQPLLHIISRCFATSCQQSGHAREAQEILHAISLATTVSDPHARAEQYLALQSHLSGGADVVGRWRLRHGLLEGQRHQRVRRR